MAKSLKCVEGWFTHSAALGRQRAAKVGPQRRVVAYDRARVLGRAAARRLKRLARSPVPPTKIRPSPLVAGGSCAVLLSWYFALCRSQASRRRRPQEGPFRALTLMRPVETMCYPGASRWGRSKRQKAHFVSGPKESATTQRSRSSCCTADPE